MDSNHGFISSKLCDALGEEDEFFINYRDRQRGVNRRSDGCFTDAFGSVMRWSFPSGDLLWGDDM